MKKIFGIALLLLLPKLTQAAITDPLVVQEKTVVLHSTHVVVSSFGFTNAPGIYDLISLSTAPGLFPHQETGEIDISLLTVKIDKLAASSGTVRIGVVNMVSPSTGSVTFFYSDSFQKNVSNTGTTIPVNGIPGFIRCKVKYNGNAATSQKDGLTPYILSNDLRSGSGLYASTNTIVSPVTPGVTFPRPGDIVMEATNFDATNSVIITVDIEYHSEP